MYYNPLKQQKKKVKYISNDCSVVLIYAFLNFLCKTVVVIIRKLQSVVIEGLCNILKVL